MIHFIIGLMTEAVTSRNSVHLCFNYADYCWTFFVLAVQVQNTAGHSCAVCHSGCSEYRLVSVFCCSKPSSAPKDEHINKHTMSCL